MSHTLEALLLSSAMLLIACEAVPYMHPSVHREERAVYELTNAEMEEFVDIHNDYRRKTGASNMREMIWDEELAGHAHSWIQECVWAHPAELNGEGQNLYIVFNDVGADVQRPTTNASITDWYKEIIDYHYDIPACKPLKVCGHYTQVVWAKTYKVGCAIHKCDKIVINDAEKTGWYVGCNYSPAGNYRGAKPYTEGDVCSECDNGMRCENNMCSDCDAEDSGCECKVQCSNGGTANAECKCDCPSGYYSDRCEKECVDDDSCDPAPGQSGWPEFWCQTHSFVPRYCPKMCGLCADCNPEDPGCECEVQCSNGGTANAECKCDCPNDFYGDNCEKQCVDDDYRCDPDPGQSGWPESWCHDDGEGYVKEYCPHMCGICVDCNPEDPGCECKVQCSNGGTANAECKCDCPNGFYGDECEQQCVDDDYRCDPDPGQSGWPESWCHDDREGYVKEYCPHMCGICVDCNPEDPGCECKVQCSNGGTANAECKCDCLYGFYGDECEQQCVADDYRCDPAPGQSGWPEFWCHDDEKEYVKNYCPHMCGICG